MQYMYMGQTREPYGWKKMNTTLILIQIKNTLVSFVNIKSHKVMTDWVHENVVHKQRRN